MAPNLTIASLAVPLTPGMTQSLDRVNQLDVSLNKAFVFGRNRIQSRFDAFNALNVNPVLSVLGSAFGQTNSPTVILDGRTFRAGVQMSF